MRLKTHLLLWILLATVVPLTALTLGATRYSEVVYREGVAEDIGATLNTVVGEISRRLQSDQEILRGLATVPALQDYLPVMATAARGDLHPDFFERTARLAGFLGTFQGIVPGFAIIRVLDRSANTLVKVENRRRSPNVFDGIESYPYAEVELNNAEFVAGLEALPAGEVTVTLLPQSRIARREAGQSLPLLDYILPLEAEGERLGYLAVNIRGEHIDHILDFAPRVYQGQLLIAELNPDDPARDGVLLFDDAGGSRFSDPKTPAEHMDGVLGGRLSRAVAERPFGLVEDRGAGRAVYYTEFLPYPDQLVSWVVAMGVDLQALGAPFAGIRLAIWAFAGLAVLLALLFSTAAARTVAAPVVRLAAGLKAFADGDRRRRVAVGGMDEVRELEESFNYMADTLERARQERDHAERMATQSAKLASVGQLAAGIGHEINNPLNNILQLAKLAERGLPEGAERARQDLRDLREETLRASRIVRDILNFARQVPPRRERFEVGPWLEETLDLARQVAARARVRLQAGSAPGLELVGDRGQLQQVLVNLLLNAVQASPAESMVEVAARAGDGALVISVADRGPGLPETDRDRLFDPFYTTKPVGQGTGLGLSIGLGIVEHHGGTLTLENRAGGGAVATIRLPPDADGSE
ncbi:sensor histidine kinase [Thioalbus denitrificans]|uniref:histidine kinase n=1 Tax=Thioalbus denitrificans TaxID=547122 RepID=A0A369C0Y3_9GAMM|nr:HAMP domain-containing sensor histidine kinase [Thioalbus denitrificans]RCX26327.1 HAMP domain-containing protein [Thioalbus denitrificans]